MRWERLPPFYASALLIALTSLTPRLRLRARGSRTIFGMLGMIVAAYLMLALTLALALAQIAGLNTLAIHLFIACYASLAAITPPVALAAFFASRISDNDPRKTSVHAARLGIVLYFLPIFFLFEPALILQGPLHLTAIRVVLNILAVLLIAAASEGQLAVYGRLPVLTRAPLFAAGLLIGFPEWTSTIGGLAIAAAVLAAPPAFARSRRTLPPGGAGAHQRPLAAVSGRHAAPIAAKVTAG